MPGERVRQRHPSVVRLIQSYEACHGGVRADPEYIVRKKARDLVQYAGNLGWTGPPFNPHILASSLGMRIIPAELPCSVDAMIVPAEEGRFQILLNTLERPPERQNFSICHEIAHTFFPDCADFIRMRRDQPDKADPNREIETLCNIAASELLFPAEPFFESVREHGFSLRAIEPVAGLYHASRTATIIKMVGTGIRVCAAVFLEPGLRKSEMRSNREAAARMRVVYSIPSPGFSYFIPKNKSAPEGSCVYRAIESGEITEGEEDWGIPGHPSYHVEAMYLPPLDESDQVPRAAALLVPGG